MEPRGSYNYENRCFEYHPDGIQRFESLKELRRHLVEQHGMQFNFITDRFFDRSEFLNWKRELEHATSKQYVQKIRTMLSKNGDLKHCYRCAESKQLSKKLIALCTSVLIAKFNSVDDSVKCKLCTTHYHHSLTEIADVHLGEVSGTGECLPYYVQTDAFYRRGHNWKLSCAVIDCTFQSIRFIEFFEHFRDLHPGLQCIKLIVTNRSVPSFLKWLEEIELKYGLDFYTDDDVIENLGEKGDNVSVFYTSSKVNTNSRNKDNNNVDEDNDDDFCGGLLRYRSILRVTRIPNEYHRGGVVLDAEGYCIVIEKTKKDKNSLLGKRKGGGEADVEEDEDEEEEELVE